MALNTKIKIDDNHVVQEAGTTLTLSGTTKYGAHPTFTTDTQLVDKKYVDDNIISGATSATTYNLGSPAAVEVGGITVDYVLTGKSTNCILQDMLYPELCGTITAPSMSSVVLTPGTTPIEVGTVCNLSVAASFSRGSINPQYCSASTYRSGAPISYCFTGAQLNGEEACTSTLASTGITSYTILAGNNTWGACTCYSAGVPALNNKNNEYCAALGAGIVAGATDTIVGILPYFYGVSVSAPTPNSALLTAGSKVVQTSTGTVCITYGVQTSKYLWFATPCASTTKLGWYEGATNKGNIGTPSDLFDAPTAVSVNSPSSCWSAECYKFYVSTISTDTSANLYCMTNVAQQ